MTYRNDLGALAARKEALETEVRDRQRELDEASRMVDEFHARARLPVLDNIRIAEPCTARWSQMVGDDRVRACGDCKKDVFNLSSLTRDEAEALIIEKAGKLCVRYFQRADGTILLKQDCEVGVKRRRRRRWMALGVAASIAGTVFGYLRTREPMVMMGAVRAPRGFIGEPIAPEIRYAQPPGHVKVGELRQQVIPRPRPTMGIPVFHPPATKPQR